MMISTPAEKKSSESEWAKFYRKFMLFKSILHIACSVITFVFVLLVLPLRGLPQW